LKTVALPKITQADAEQEPAADRLTFPATRPYAKNRAVIHAVYDGFHVQFELCDIGIARVVEFIGQLTERGYTPGGVTPPAPAKAPNTNGHAPALSEPPACPQHNRPMKPMKYADKLGNTFMCTAKVGDGWCAERA
jgi:hypothetical protein